MTTQEASAHIRAALAQAYPEGEIRGFIRIIFEEWMHYSTVDMIMRADSELPDFVTEKIDGAIARLLRHEPIQHIVGAAHFHGHRFRVTPHTLIPRPETEQLVDIITDQNTASDLRVLDVGTGSGCIAISLARALKFADVSAIDVSQAALDVAAENAAALGVKVRFILADILKAAPKPEQYNIIVSNPPYIRVCEKQQMDDNVLLYEPASALFVPDDDPLLFYRAITSYAATALMPKGWLYFEINADFGDETAALLRGAGFDEVTVARDFYGRNRFVYGQLNRQ